MIGNEGATTIAEYLKDNKTIEEIDLGGNQIYFDGLEAILNALGNNATLRNISFGK